MRKNKSPLSISVATALAFMVVVTTQALSRQAPKVEQQTLAAEPVAGEPSGFTSANTGVSSSLTVSPDERWDSASAQAAIDAEAIEAASVTPAAALSGGIDHVAAGTGTRNSGHGTICIRGVPSSPVVIFAYLYWGTIYASPAPFSATAVFRGTSVTGSLIGTSTQPCWNSSGVFAVYRANVKSLILAGVNGDYKVTGLASAVTNNSNPWSTLSNTLPLSEGASLVVLYSHSSVPSSSQFYLYHGPHFTSSTLTITTNFSPPIPSHSILKHTRIGADGQIGTGIKPISAATDEKTYIGPTTASLVLIRGSGSGRNYTSDFNGINGWPLNQLWDTNTDDITGTIPAGAGSYVTRYVSRGDCIEIVAQILNAR